MMNKTSEEVTKVISSQPVRDADKLKRQQAYYERLKKAGIVKQQTYNLKPLSVI